MELLRKAVCQSLAETVCKYDSHLHRTRQETHDASEAPPLDVDYQSEVEILSYLGGGADCDVYAGIWRGREVLSSVLDAAQAGKSVLGSAKEVSLLSRLDHPNIVRFLAACTTPPHLCMIQELAVGTLFDLLHTHHLRPQYGRLLALLVDIASAMDYCHAGKEPIIHRDLKTKNVLLGEAGRVLLADFGIARVKDATFLRTSQPGSGTVAYLAPEILRDEKVDEKCDVYAFGVVLWECLTGQKPWNGWLPMQVTMLRADGLKKASAGLLIVSDGEALLLLRSLRSGNPSTWGLPGGNIDKDETPIAAALRETNEELGKQIPNYKVKSEIETMRGKHMNKLYVVFVVEVSPDDKAAFKPKLNDEHVDYRWFTMNDIPGTQNLHPVVKKLFAEHSEELSAALAAS